MNVRTMYVGLLIAVMTLGLMSPAAAVPPPASTAGPMPSLASTGICTRAPNPPNRFRDVPDDALFCVDIAWMASSGITEGRGDGTYGPGDPVRRGHMAAFLYRFAGEPPIPVDAPRFRDVTPTHTFFDEISWLAAEGISLGRGDGTFLPNDALTRGQMAAFLFRFDGGIPAREQGLSFPDVPPDHQFADAVAWMVASGITTGLNDGTFGVNQGLTRGQMSAFLYRYDQSLQQATPSEQVVQPDEWQLAGGDVQVTLLWTGGEDLDLRVVDPDGEQINSTNPVAASGGLMDRSDSPSCAAVDATHGENVAWELGSAPEGRYEAFVTVNTSCDYHGWLRLEVRLDGVLVESLSAPTNFDRSDDVDARIEFTYPPGALTDDEPPTDDEADDEPPTDVDDPAQPDESDEPDEQPGDDAPGPGLDLGPAATYLSEQSPVDSSHRANWGSGDARVDTIEYRRSLTAPRMGTVTTGANERWLEFDLNRGYERFRATVGVRDDSTADSRARFEVFADGRLLATEVVEFGMSRDLDVEVIGAMRVRVQVTWLEGRELWGVYANPHVIVAGVPDETSGISAPVDVEPLRQLSQQQPVDSSHRANWDTGDALLDTMEVRNSLTAPRMGTVTTGANERWLEFDLNRGYERFRATVGVRDDSTADSRARFEVFADGRLLVAETLTLGDTRPLDVDVSGAMRVRLQVTWLEGRELRGVYGDAQVVHSR